MLFFVKLDGMGSGFLLATLDLKKNLLVYFHTEVCAEKFGRNTKMTPLLCSYDMLYYPFDTQVAGGS